MEEGCDTALLHTQGCTLNQGHRRASRELRRARGAATALQPHTAPRVLSACTRRPRTGPKVWGPIPAPGILRPTATILRVPAQPCGARGGRGVAVRAGMTLSPPGARCAPHAPRAHLCFGSSGRRGGRAAHGRHRRASKRPFRKPQTTAGEGSSGTRGRPTALCAAPPRSCAGSSPAPRGCHRARCISGSSQLYLYHALRSSRCTAAAGAKVREGESGSRSTAGTGKATRWGRRHRTRPTPTLRQGPVWGDGTAGTQRGPPGAPKEAVWVGSGERPPAHVAPGGTGRRARSQPPRSHGHGARGGGGGWEPHGMAQTLQMTAERRTRGRAQRTPAEPPYRQRVGTAPPRPAPYLGVKVALPAVSAVPAGGGERR